MSSHHTVYYAGFWKRFDAFSLDLLIVLAISLVLASIFVPIINPKIPIDIFNAHFLNKFLPIAEIIFITYNTFFIIKYGATPGKKVYKLKVVTAALHKPNLRQTILREVIGRVIDFTLLWIPNLAIVFTKKKQALHDIIAKTYVIKK